MSVFVHAQGIKTVHARRGGVKKCQNSVHVVVECPLTQFIDPSSVNDYRVFMITRLVYLALGYRLLF